MPERSWDELIEEGRALLKQEGDLKWHWADLALAVEPMGRPNVTTGSHGRLEKWAEEMGWFEAGRAFQTLRQYRETANAWPPERRLASTSYTVHNELRWHDERFDLIRGEMTLSQARQAAGRSIRSRIVATDGEEIERTRELLSDPEVARAVMADAQVRHVVDEARPMEDRAEQARRLVRDPAVARHVVQDNTARSAMAKAAKEMEDEAEERQRKRAPSLVGMSDFYAATGELSRMRQAGMKSLDAMRKLDLSEDQRESLKDDHNRVRLVSEWIDSYLDSGDHSFDKELDTLLREET